MKAIPITLKTMKDILYSKVSPALVQLCIEGIDLTANVPAKLLEVCY